MQQFSVIGVTRALLAVARLCAGFHEGSAPVEHVGALIRALDAFDGVSQAHLREVTGHGVCRGLVVLFIADG